MHYEMDTDENDELVVFAGPSLFRSPYKDKPGSRVLPPVEDGSLLPVARLLGEGRKILIIDGYFGAGQSLTIAEISESLRYGVGLYGSTSMGALRAVEAGPLGMIGLGKIFESFRDGIYVADEEVCLIHDETFCPLSVPNVNLRCLCKIMASQAGADTESIRHFFHLARSINFRERSISGVRKAGEAALDAKGAEALERLLAKDSIEKWNVKRQDAEDVIDQLLSNTHMISRSCEPDGLVPSDPRLLLAGPTDDFG
jgi:hypothetical protein